MAEEKIVYKRPDYLIRAEKNYRAKMAFINVRIPKDMVPKLDQAADGNRTQYLYRLMLKDMKERGIID